MKIGVMGGTFYPIHKGHLKLAECALKQYELDEIWFMPNGIPPHKSNPTIEEMTKHRVAMVRLAIEEYEHFVLQPYEVENTEVSYSYKTMLHFKETYPNDSFYFIIGADSLFTLETWKHPEILLKQCVVLAACRDGQGIDDMHQQVNHLQTVYECDIRLLNMPFEDISSTELRHKMYQDTALIAYLPEKVFAYIVEHQLFYTDKILSLDKQLRENLDDARYRHSVGVMQTAALLAYRYCFDVERAMVAGLLHDCAKCISGKDKLRMCEEAGLSISDIERKSPGLLHAKLGAYLANKKYGIRDEELLDSIRYHCTGRPQMTLFDKIIYIADYIEPHRDKAPNLANIRELAYLNIDQCLVAVLKATLLYLDESGQLLDPMTAKTYEYYSEIVE